MDTNNPTPHYGHGARLCSKNQPQQPRSYTSPMFVIAPESLLSCVSCISWFHIIAVAIDPQRKSWLAIRDESPMSVQKSVLDDLRINRAQPEKRSHAPAIIIAGIGALLVVVAFWFWRGRQAVIVVQTVPVRSTGGSSSGQTTVLNGTGYVTPRREATVSSKVTGKVVEVLIEEGMRVKAGQVLARVDDTNIRASLDLATAQLAAAKSALGETEARLQEAKKTHIRVLKLITDQIATQAELDGAEAEVNSLQARLDQQRDEAIVAERQVALWQQQLDDTVIRAPFDGVIVAKNAQPGEMISPMSAGGGFTRTGICTIVDMESLEVEVEVSESYINRVEAGQPVEATLDSYPDWRIPAKVIAIIPTANRQNATVRVRVGFEKLDPRILPQMGVKVAFRGSNGNGAAPVQRQIPKSAVREEGDQSVVYVVHNGRAERRALRLGPATDTDVAVQAGLSDGERVIVSAPANLAEGARVKEKNR
jgi:RND family efflux transporter MFP subunit